MKKAIRVLMLLAVIFALYAGVTTQTWPFPIGIIAISSICFLATMSGTRTSNLQSRKESSIIIVAAGAASSENTSGDCGSSGGDC